MNRTEATQIVTYLNRAGLVGAMEGQAAVWADALEDVSYVTAQEVVRAMTKTRTSGLRWVTPGDVRDAVTTIRRDRLAKIRPVDPPSALDGIPARENAWAASYRRAIGDGLDTTDAYVAACAEHGIAPHAIESGGRPVKSRLAQIAASTALPRDVVQGARRDVANEVRR